MTRTDLANIALGLLGARRIDDLDTSGSVEARACRLHFPHTFRSMLRRHQWSFGTRRLRPQATGGPLQAATSITGVQQSAIRWTARTPGSAGNEILRAILEPNTSAASPAVVVFPNIIRVIPAGAAPDPAWPTANPVIPAGVARHIQISGSSNPSANLVLAYHNSIDGYPAYSSASWTPASLPLGSDMLQSLSNPAILRVNIDISANPESWFIGIRLADATDIRLNGAFGSPPQNPAAVATWSTVAGNFAGTPAVATLSPTRVSTAREVSDAVNAHPAASSLVSTTPLFDGTAPVEFAAPAFLAGGSEPPSTEWQFSFALPPDFVRLVRLATTDPHNPIRSFTIEGRSILTDTPEFEIVYISDDVLDDLDDLFIDAFTMSLASKLGGDVLADPNLKQSLLAQIEQLHLPAAQNVDAKEVASGENFSPRALASMSALVRSRFQGDGRPPFIPTLP